MTYILNTTHSPNAGITTARIAVRAAVSAKRVVVTTFHILVTLPASISRAFAMAYADPYHPTRKPLDHSDPQNF